MKTIIIKRLSLILVPVISTFLFVAIITAAPITITEKMDTQEIQTIAVVDPQAVISTDNTNTPSTEIPSPTPDTTKPNSTSAPVKKVQPQPSRSTSTSKSTTTSTSRSTTTSTSTTANKSSTPQTKASAVIATGKKYIGVKYVYGGTTPSGFDCSGFVQYAFAKNGVSLPRVSRDQFKVGTSVSFSNLQPGDLVFFSFAKNGVVDHVGIYVGNGQFINASSSKGVTIYTLGSYWKSIYIGAKRVL